MLGSNVPQTLTRRKSEIFFTNLKDMLKSVFKKTQVWQMVPNCNELLVISNRFSVKEVVEILSDNLSVYCLLVDQEFHQMWALFLFTDFINFLLSLNTTNRNLLENEALLEDYLRETEIRSFLEDHKKYAKSNRSIYGIIDKYVM